MTAPDTPTAEDRRLLHAAARRTALQATALVAVVALVLVSLVAWLMLAGQRRQVDDLLVRTAASADDVVDPPPDGWIVIERGAVTVASRGLPPQLAGRLRALRSQPPPPGGHTLTDVRLDGSPGAGGEGYRVVTRSVPTGRGEIVQVAVAQSRWTEDRERILALAGITAAVGLVLAGVVGLALGHRAVRPLGQALALQRRFVADASHELRTPLTLLSTRAQVLARTLERDGVSPGVVADAQGVVADSRRLAEALDDLLLAATTGAEAEVAEAVDLAALAAEVVESARDHAAREGVDLRLVDGSAPSLCAPAAVRRALVALVDNALTHTPRGGSVTVTPTSSRGLAVVTVTDTGPGVDPAGRERIFERFASGGHRAGRRHYGLGLALAREVAERQGGTLRLADTGPEGTTFELALPLGAGSVAGRSPRTDQPDQAGRSRPSMRG